MPKRSGKLNKPKVLPSSAVNQLATRSLKRLCYRAGIKRMSGTLYMELRKLINTITYEIVEDAIKYSECAQRKTVTGKDIEFAIKSQRVERRIYG